MLRNTSDDAASVASQQECTQAAAPATTTEQANAISGHAHTVVILKEMVSEQASIIASLNREIGSVQNDNKNILQRNGDLSAENEALKQDNKALRQEIERKKENFELQNAMAELTDNNMRVHELPPQPYSPMLAAAEPRVEYQRQRPGTT